MLRGLTAFGDASETHDDALRPPSSAAPATLWPDRADEGRRRLLAALGLPGITTVIAAGSPSGPRLRPPAPDP